MAANKWSGDGLSQEDFMRKDQCILVDDKDVITGSGSKYETHVFSKERPRGILHRAFSVFLFNKEGKLLLQQRAASKITFPNVWTNTCCSHPLYGYDPNEVDQPSAVADGSVMGAKAAAIRKLFHELGIDSKDIPITTFKFLTRLHYWAADVVTHGINSPWGEHEMDYILFIQVDKKELKCRLNSEEVSAVKYVTAAELQTLMDPSSGLLWSPWFRIIAQQFLIPVWWKDIKRTLTTNDFVDVHTIHHFDPAVEHMGGAGGASHWLGQCKGSTNSGNNGNANGSDNHNDNGSNGNATITAYNKAIKQGAYGKVKIHDGGKWEQYSHIDEIFAGLWLKYIDTFEDKIHTTTPALEFCKDSLIKVSRSFAMVIQQLPSGLCKDIMVFYLVLRALDTIEDDMEAFKGHVQDKIHHLCNFYEEALLVDGYHLDGVGEGDERDLLEHFYNVATIFRELPRASQEVISDICRRMGCGMASFVEIDLGQGTKTVQDYNQYCHYVAGMIGEGLSKLFTCTGYENHAVASVATTTANTMGLFLQKTNIIRDYLEDYVDGRTFYPQEIWRKYSETGELGEFSRPEASARALYLLNDLITDALQCIPDCVSYMSLLRTEETFRFCAIPQVMAIATLAEMYNNHDVFTGVVKIRRGLTAKLILETKSHDGLHKWFYLFTTDILKKIPNNDPNAAATREICRKILQLTSNRAWTAIYGGYAAVANNVVAPIALGTSACMLWRHINFVDLTKNFNTTGSMSNFAKIINSLFTPQNTFLHPNANYTDILAVGACVGSLVFMLCYSIVSTGKPKLRKGDVSV